MQRLPSRIHTNRSDHEGASGSAPATFSLARSISSVVGLCVVTGLCSAQSAPATTMTLPVVLQKARGYGNPPVPQGIAISNASSVAVSLRFPPLVAAFVGAIGFNRPLGGGNGSWGTPWGFTTGGPGSFQYYNYGGLEVYNWDAAVTLVGVSALDKISIGLDDALGNTIVPPVSVPYDPRNDAQVAGAPKVDLTDNNGYIKFGLSPGAGGHIIAGGKINDPGYPLNPLGLTLEFDENGVHRSVVVLVGPDGRFNIDQRFFVGSSGSFGRPLLLYHRTGGDNINVGYYGNGTEIERRRELKYYQYGSVREKVNEAVKNVGRFPGWRQNGVVMGVRG